MLDKVLKIVFGSKHERDIRQLRPIVEKINDLEEACQALSDEELSRSTSYFRERLSKGESLEDLLPEAFARVREASWRSLGMRHFNVQLIGGMVLHQGKISEMKTGEGKTLTSTLSVYLNALSGKGVHVVTVNDYLARRDALWMKPVYSALGASVAYIQHDMLPEERRAAYLADITYGTNNEFGFDYLRDNMVTDSELRVQRGHNYAIVDEVDSILIDEARTPLIISGPTDERTELYVVVDRAIRQLLDLEKKAPPPPPVEVEPGKEEPHLIRGYYYDVDEKSRNALLTEAGVGQMEELLRIENLFAPENVDLVAHTNQALRAHLIFQNEVDYVVQNNEVLIVDEFTGRLMEGRRYSDGLHQALEAKEKVEIKRESQTLATITFQNYFRMYSKLAGMTGTADTEADEFKKIYKLEVVVIPTNVQVARKDYPDRVYRSEREKWNAIIEEIKTCHLAGQPVLVGTISVEKSEYLSGLLKKAGIPHNVLNAKQHAREAEIVENAGKPGAVTVATNMAGRGTDIVLGGYPLYTRDMEALEEDQEGVVSFKVALRKRDWEAAQKAAGQAGGQAVQARLREIYDRAMIWKRNHEEVKQSGGLHILGTERHEARRIDNQLRGRAGRQGDPGSSRFYLSMEDNLMRIFGGERVKNWMTRLGMEEGQELEARMVDRAIARAQKRVENHNFDIRKHLLEYDDVMNKQREYIYKERNFILDNENVQAHLFTWMQEVLEQEILNYCPDKDPSRWDTESLGEYLRSLIGTEVIESAERYSKSTNPQLDLFNDVWQSCEKAYRRKAESVGEENLAYVERRIALDVIDARWKEHLYSMDHLREGIWSISYAEKNPLVEYKLEGFRLFDEMSHNIKAQITVFLFRVQIQGPVDMQPAQRTRGREVHNEIESFSGSGGIPLHNQTSGARETRHSHSSGGASQKKKTRRQRRV